MIKYKTIITILTVICATLSSCTDNFDIDKLNTSPKMVVYCFPSAADTTYINITQSIPVQKKTKQSVFATIDDARITYMVNGVQRAATFMGRGKYYVTGKQKEGDKIQLEVSADGLPSVSASTTIPPTPKIESFETEYITEYDSYESSSENYEQLRPTFTDTPKTKNYYAVRAAVKMYLGYGKGDSDYKTYHYDATDERVKEWVITDSIIEHETIEVKDEPLLKPLSDIDEDFGFENSVYKLFYAFNDNIINGKSYTMHLNISPYERTSENYLFAKAGVELFAITPEYYKFITSLNDADNNGMAEVGLSQITPTYSNITGGIGLLGAYNETEAYIK